MVNLNSLQINVFLFKDMKQNTLFLKHKKEIIYVIFAEELLIM